MRLPSPVTEWRSDSVLDLKSPWLSIVGGVAQPVAPGVEGQFRAMAMMARVPGPGRRAGRG
jgi:hypothetical protein